MTALITSTGSKVKNRCISKFLKPAPGLCGRLLPRISPHYPRYRLMSRSVRQPVAVFPGLPPRCISLQAGEPPGAVRATTDIAYRY